ncbi:MAG: hypothetical protein AAFN93_24155 [Bacteroidota bacterium]
MKKLLILISVFYFSCQSDEELKTGPILTIELEGGPTQEGFRSFYSVKGEGGEDIDFGELRPGRTLVSNDSYDGEKIAVTFFTTVPFTFSSAESFLDIPVGQVIKFKRVGSNSPVSNNTATVKFENFPEDFDRVILTNISNSDSFKPVSLGHGRDLFFDFNSNDPFTVVVFVPLDGPPEYQTLNMTNNITIDGSNNSLMENENLIPLSNIIGDSAYYSFNVSGLPQGFSNAFPRYSLGSKYFERIESNMLKFYTPRLFDNHFVSLDIHAEESLYRQFSFGDIPETFHFLDVDVHIDTTFINHNIDLSTTEDLTFVSSHWRSNIGQEALIWNITSPPIVVNDYAVEQIPELIKNSIDGLRRLENLRLIRVKNTVVDDLSYASWLEKQWDGNGSLDLMTVEKSVSF